MQNNANDILEMGILANEVYRDIHFIVGTVIKNVAGLQNSYKVVQTQDTLVGDSYPNLFGFQAFLLEELDSSDNGTGEYVIAFRGTEPDNGIYNGISDLATDASMAVGNFTVQMRLALDFVDSVLEKYEDTGITTENLTFTGHSLGGSLAEVTGFTFGSETYAYNPFGVKWSLVQSPDVYLATLAVLGVFPEMTTGNITNIVNVGDDFSDKATGIWSHLLDRYLGDILYVKNSEGGGTFAPHGMDELNDSIAVYNALLEIFSDETYTSITNTIELFATNEQEVPNFLEALGGILNVSNTGSSKDYIKDIINVVSTSSLSLSLVCLAETDSDGNSTVFSPSKLESLSRNNDIAYRYALVNLNPFAILGVDYSEFNQNGELDIYNEATGEGQLTNMYLSDRAEMLANLLYANLNDTDNSDSDIYFNDMQQNIVLNKPLLLAPEKSIIFGSDASDSIEGSGSALISYDTDDHLYGMGGDDTLDGGDGNDYLEGGDGDDVLIGGEGADELVGGEGVDIYYIDGHDTIDDSDNNYLFYNDEMLVGGFLLKPGTNKYEAIGDSGVSLTLDDSENISINTNDSIHFTQPNSVGDLIAGDWGVKLFELPEFDFEVSGTENDDETKATIFSYAVDPVTKELGPLGTYVFGGVQRFVYSESAIPNITVDGGAGNDKIFGLAGKDFIQGGSGNDLILGEVEFIVEDPDIGDLYNPWGNMGAGDVLQGGAGNDLIIAAIGDDIVSGGEDDDCIDGGADDDILEGDGGNDLLAGSSGSDLLKGGAGDDVLAGDYYLSNTDMEVLASTDISLIDMQLFYHDEYGYPLTPSFNNTALLSSEEFGDDRLYGGFGHDYLLGGGGADTLYGESGNDSLFGGAHNDILNGGDGNDMLLGDEGTCGDLDGDDILNGGAGDDFLFGDGGDDTLNGGDGSDMLMGDDGSDGSKGGNDKLTGGAGNDFLFGEGGDDVLEGGAGDDDLYGGSGDDTLSGGSGNDWLIGGAGDDTYLINVGEGKSIIEDTKGMNTVNFGFGYDVNSLTLSKSDSDIVMWFNGSPIAVFTDWFLSSNDPAGHFIFNDGKQLTANKFLTDNGVQQIGGDGNDILQSSQFHDQLSGGIGDDVYVMDNQNDLAYEKNDEGYDTVQASVSYVLESNIEKLILTGDSALDGTGNSLDNLLIGNTAKNSLSGDDGNDVLKGFAGNDSLTGGKGNDVLDGGLGDDTLIGGQGNDVYVINSYDDLIIENLGEGHDTVQSFISYTLDSSIEDLILMGDEIISGSGNALDNLLVGNTAKNSLSGNDGDDVLQGFAGNDSLTGGKGNDILDGGLGDDSLIGGQGNDIYVVDSVDDFVHENPDEGCDTVHSFISHTLSHTFENLTLVGDAVINGIGNGMENILIGNFADNTLEGEGGDDFISGAAGDDSLIGGEGNDHLKGGDGNDTLDGGSGADTLIGGAGDDVYLLEDQNDLVLENSDEGCDTVVIATSYVLGGNLENLVLEGDGAINATGNGLDNNLIGNSASNTFWGGKGEDTIWGDGGADVIYAGDDFGEDYIFGGLGFDTYYVNKNDVVTDSDHNGVIYYQGQDIASLEFEFMCNVDLVEYYKEKNSKLIIRYDQLEGVLSGAGEFITIKNFNNGDFGFFLNRTDIFFLDPDRLFVGSAENDFINGGIGDDYLFGSFGQDKITGFLGDDSIFGGEGNDDLLGGDGADMLYGEAGTDLLVGGAGDDSLYGGSGRDVLVGDGEEETFSDGNDCLYGGSGDDVMEGCGGNDILSGDSGRDSLSGNTGDDILKGGSDRDRLYGNAGDDILYGDGGNDYLFGDDNYVDGGNDILYGGDGNDSLSGDGAECENPGDDILYGGNGNDYLTSKGGVDILYGEAGDDTLILKGLEGGTGRLVGGVGNDILEGDRGSATYVINLGDGHDTIRSRSLNRMDDLDTIEFGVPYHASSLALIRSGLDLTICLDDETRITCRNWFDVRTVDFFVFSDGIRISADEFLASAVVTIIGSEGDDELHGSVNNDSLVGGAGNDTLFGGAGDDILSGGSGRDTLYGGSGNDHLSVGGINRARQKLTDETVMFGGEGSDTYIVNPYDGHVRINDGSLDYKGTDTLAFGNGITPSSITLGQGSLLITTGIVGDEIHLENFDPQDVYGTHDIDTFQFSDGLTLTYEELLDLGFDLSGTMGDDSIIGTNVVDRIVGLAGDDFLSGGSGDDVIDGGSGTDTLLGGNGDDQFIFGLGDGNDTIYDLGGIDTLVIDDIQGGLTPDNLWIERIGNDVVVELEDGSSTFIKDWVLVENRVENIRFGTVNSAIDDLLFLRARNHDLSLYEDTAISGVIELGNAGDGVVFSVDKGGNHGGFTVGVDGSWSYAPNQDANGLDQVVVKVTNDQAEVAFSTLNLLVNPINDLPIVENSDPLVLQDVRALAGQVIASDVDGDLLSYAVSSDPVYGALTLNADGSWNYQAAAGFIGDDQATISVDDGHGDLVTTTLNFDVRVSAPSVSNYDLSLDEDSSLLSQLDVTNPVGGTLTYIVDNNSNHGNFTIAAGGRFNYTPTADYHGGDEVQLTVTNDYGLTATSTISLNVLPINDLPETVAEESRVLQDIRVVTGTIEASDIDGDILSYAVSGPAEHGSFSIDQNGNWSYEAAELFIGSDQVVVTIEDGNGGEVTSTLDFSVIVSSPEANNVDDALEEDGSANGILVVTNPIGGSLVYSVTNSGKYGSFDLDDQGNWQYRPDENYHGSDLITVIVTNEYGLTATATIDLTITSVNDAPTVVESTPYQVLGVDSVTGQVDANDVDGDLLSYQITSNSEHGTFVIDETGAWTYTPIGGFVGTDSVSVTIHDGNGGQVASSLSFVGNIYTDGDLVIDGQGPDVLKLDGIGKDDLQLNRNSEDLSVVVRDRGTITLVGYYSDPENGVEYLETTEGPLHLAKNLIIDVEPSWCSWCAWLFSRSEEGTTGEKNLLYGTDSGEIIYGANVNDVLFGGRGNDRLYGDDGDDTLVGDNGCDTLQGGLGNDTLYGDAHADNLLGNAGNDALVGGDGNDCLQGGTGNDWLWGDDGCDTLYGEEGADSISGSLGDDRLYGGGGNDLYLFNRNDGYDQLYDNLYSGFMNFYHEDAGQDTVRFGADIGKEDVAVYMSCGNLYLSYGDTDVVKINDQSNDKDKIEHFELADGSYLTDTDINQLIQEISSFAVSEGICVNSVNDVRRNDELMTLVAAAWH